LFIKIKVSVPVLVLNILKVFVPEPVLLGLVPVSEVPIDQSKYEVKRWESR